MGWPSGAVNTTGGNPGNYAETRLAGQPGSIVSAYWVQSFKTTGSYPYVAAIRFDYRVFEVFRRELDFLF